MTTSNDQDTTPSGKQQVLLPPGVVVIVGGGPIGLILARTLSYYGVRSILFERNQSTTKWPKMDLTNARSMEIFRKLGLADGVREQGVPAHFDNNVLFSSGLASKHLLSMWKLPGVDEYRTRIRETNDGTLPREAWQRISQAVFERWLKGVCDEDPLIELHYGYKVETVQEEDTRVRTTVLDPETGRAIDYVSDYVAGCDGASSRVRRSLNIPLEGGPVPACALLVHFKSRDLTRLHTHGRFWHIFFTGPHGGLLGAIIAQNEADIWTTHLFVPLEEDTDAIGTEEAVFRVLGGIGEPYPIKIDEVLVRSTWRPYIAVAETWHSPGWRVFLAGDACHQNIPTGGYGFNTGIGDAFDLGWKLASVINGHGGEGLLRSYEPERKPVGMRNVERSGSHFEVLRSVSQFFEEGDVARLDEDTERAGALRAKVDDHLQKNDGENRDLGIELGYRYVSPIVINNEEKGTEPVWVPSRYTPTSWPGGRPPHVFLSDGSALFDKLGKYWTLLVFTNEEKGQHFFAHAAKALDLPLETVDLSQEDVAKGLYEREFVLMRPDQHVAWRSDDGPATQAEATTILETVMGRSKDSVRQRAEDAVSGPREAFTGTMELTTQTKEFELDRMADFQR